jgi:hypothetical protein
MPLTNAERQNLWRRRQKQANDEAYKAREIARYKRYEGNLTARQKNAGLHGKLKV